VGISFYLPKIGSKKGRTPSRSKRGGEKEEVGIPVKEVEDLFLLSSSHPWNGNKGVTGVFG